MVNALVRKGPVVVGLGILLVGGRALWGADTQIVLSRAGRTVVLEPYATNIVRITVSSEKAAALAVPGYGFVGRPSIIGWTHEQDSGGYDVIRSQRMIVRISPEDLPPPHAMPLDALNQSLREHYFGGGPQRPGPFNDTISITTASGRPLLTMRNWSMMPNQPESSSGSAIGGQKVDPGYRVSAVFDSPADEHYYGLGQHQQGLLDLRDHRINCWHDYSVSRAK